MNSDGLSSPEQFGVWEVDGVGLCVAFRGTASTEDVLIDVNITPTPLETSRNMRGGLPWICVKPWLQHARGLLVAYRRDAWVGCQDKLPRQTLTLTLTLTRTQKPSAYIRVVTWLAGLLVAFQVLPAPLHAAQNAASMFVNA